MEKSAQNIQDSFLNNARKEKTVVTIYLLGGVRLNGRIKSFDKYSLILESSSQEHLVFKHAISTVVTARSSPSGAEAHTGSGVGSGLGSNTGSNANSTASVPPHTETAPGQRVGTLAGSLEG